jgi:phage tail tube protein FII
MENKTNQPIHKDGAVIVGGEYSEFDTEGTQSSVVMMGGKAVEIRNGQIVKKAEDKSNEELAYEKENIEEEVATERVDTAPSE